MKDLGLQDYDRLSRFLRAVALRLQARAALDFVLLFSTAFLVALLGGILPLLLGKAFWFASFVYSLAALGSLAFLLFLGLRRLFPRPPPGRVARDLEERFPQLRDDLTNSLLLFPELQGAAAPDRTSAGLIAAQIRKTAEQALSLPASELVRFGELRRRFRLLVPLLLGFFAVLFLEPPFLTRSLALLIHPLSALPGRETRITLEPEGSVVLRGTPVAFQARAEGTVPERLYLALWPEEGAVKALPMAREGDGRFAYRIPGAEASFRYQAYDGRTTSRAYSLRVVDPPEILRVRLTLTPPAYSGLPTETRDSGHIEALRGTSVSLEGQASRDVVSGEMILDQENPLALEVRGEAFRGSLVVLEPGQYSLRLKDAYGFENPEPVQYAVRLIPDKPPEAEILQPAQDLEINGGEEIPILYAGRDDFGLTAVKLLYQRGGREYALDLKSPGRGRALAPQRFLWETGSLALTPGEKITYRLAVWDNDTVSGPKAGFSRSFTLSVRDERSKAASEAEEALRISEALLSLLADHLEEARDREGLVKRMEEILKRLDRILERPEEGGERLDYGALRKNLVSLKERMPFEPREMVTQELERLALLAEEIAKQARMNELEILARELRNRQERLLEQLKDLKGNLTKEALDAALKELQKLTELLQAVMARFSQLAPQLPDEFVNSPDLSGLDLQDMFSEMEEIQKKLLEGDLAGALDAAQRLLQSLSQMMAAMGRAGAQAGRSQAGRLGGEMSQQASELDRLLAEQTEILRETERLERELRGRVEEEAERRLKEAGPRLKEALEELRKVLSGEEREVVDLWEKLLQEGKTEPFAADLRERSREPRPDPEARRRFEDLKEIADGLAPDPRELLDPEQKEKFPGLSSRQEALRDRTRALRERLEALSQLFPGLDTEVLRDLQAAADSMGEASGRLRGEDAPGAVPPEQEVLRRLNRSQQGMSQMAQQMAMRSQFHRWGQPYGYDPRPGWYYGPWSPMPTLPQPEVDRPPEQGYTGIDRKEFDPPSKDAYQVPQNFRERVMEALKEEIPSPYKKDVEKYFRGLSE